MAVFTFDFSPSGPLKIVPFFTTFALPDYSGSAGWWRMFFEIGIIVMVVAMLYGEANEMREVGLASYLSDFWNAFDLANCTLMLILGELTASSATVEPDPHTY
jgi:hypothetical protein